MRSNLVLALGCLAAPAWADYGNKACKAGPYNGGSCLWAAAYCKDDCRSFLQATVTPCPSTSTVTRTTVVVNPPTTATVTSSVTTTNTVTNTATATVTATSDITATATTPVTDIVTSIMPIYETSTVTVTAATTTIPSKKRKMKRAVITNPLPVIPAPSPDVHARNADTRKGPSVCTPKTSHPTHLPWYAWGCNGPSQYSSACSCVGVSTRTTTLPASTTTVTTTSTIQSTPIVTATATATSTDSATVTQTATTVTTLITTDATETIPATTVETTTESTTLVTTSTVTVTPAPTCSTYNFVVSNGQYSGEFLIGQEPNPTSSQGYGFIMPTATPSSPGFWTLRSDGRVYGGDNVYGWVSNGGNLYYILEMTDLQQSTYGIPSVFCTLDNSIPTGGIAGAVGVLSCVISGNAVGLAFCPQTSNKLAKYPGSLPAGCTAVNIVAVPSC